MLKWFGHVERERENNWVKKCTRRMNVTGVVDRGAPRKTWSCVERDSEGYGYKGGKLAQDRCAWRNVTGGLTCASADA